MGKFHDLANFMKQLFFVARENYHQPNFHQPNIIVNQISSSILGYTQEIPNFMALIYYRLPAGPYTTTIPREGVRYLSPISHVAEFEAPRLFRHFFHDLWGCSFGIRQLLALPAEELWIPTAKGGGYIPRGFRFGFFGRFFRMGGMALKGWKFI